MLKKADIGVGLYLLAAVVFFIVPIPSDITFVYDYFSNFSERIFHPSDSSDGRSW